MTTRRLTLAGGLAALGALALAATVVAAGPRSGQAAGGAAADALGLTQEQLIELRQEGLSVAQIAQQQGVTVESVVDALVARWTLRVQERVQNGGLSEEEASALAEQLRERAQAMVLETEATGMQGAAVGAGAGVAGGVGPGPRGTGDGTGECDGSGPHGAGRP
jgi:hypothetical protein